MNLNDFFAMVFMDFHESCGLNQIRSLVNKGMRQVYFQRQPSGFSQAQVEFRNYVYQQKKPLCGLIFSVI